MTDKPSVAIRGKPNSSMGIGLKLQAEASTQRDFVAISRLADQQA